MDRILVNQIIPAQACHCEERSDEAISCRRISTACPRLLRFARNDGGIWIPARRAICHRAGGRRGRVMRTVVATILAAMLATAAHAEAIKIGVLKTTTSGPVYIAQDKGYFAAEGLQSELVVFESAQPVAVATASGDIDFGYPGFTGGFYGLASQGVLRVIGGGGAEVPGYPNEPFLVSHKAYEAGFKSFKDFPGHSFGLSQFGSPPHYAMGLVAQKYGFDLKALRLVPLQTLPNMAS